MKTKLSFFFIILLIIGCFGFSWAENGVMNGSEIEEVVNASDISFNIYSVVINDDADLLNEDETRSVIKAMIQIAEFANVGFITYPIDGTDDTSSALKAQEWGNAIFGNDVNFVVFIIDMKLRHLDIYVSKPMSEVLTSDILQSIADNIYRYASRGEYGECAIMTFKLIFNILEGDEKPETVLEIPTIIDNNSYDDAGYILDHYEPVEVERSRLVVDHYETYYTYEDNGEGGYIEIPHERPVYRTEYYIEIVQQPVYVKKGE